ncbi:MAG: HPr family phosphocarrier protein [Evtepia sp.]
MISFDLRLTCLNDVGAFVRAAESLPCDITVHSGPLSVNGKSLMGILALNLNEPLTVKLAGSEADALTLREALSAYLV